MLVQVLGLVLVALVAGCLAMAGSQRPKSVECQLVVYVSVPDVEASHCLLLTVWGHGHGTLQLWLW